MSRSYSMLVRVRDVTPERVDRVKQAANDEWDFDDWHEHENSISSCVDGCLCGGETEDEFSQRLNDAISASGILRTKRRWRSSRNWVIARRKLRIFEEYRIIAQIRDRPCQSRRQKPTRGE